MRQVSDGRVYVRMVRSGRLGGFRLGVSGPEGYELQRHVRARQERQVMEGHGWVFSDLQDSAGQDGSSGSERMGLAGAVGQGWSR
jgi:hypothetical protein